MKYKALTKSADVDPEIALLQGIYALDAAAILAEENRDVDGLVEVARLWMEFSQNIQGFTEKIDSALEQAHEKASQSTISVGFQSEAIIVEENDRV